MARDTGNNTRFRRCYVSLSLAMLRALGDYTSIKRWHVLRALIRGSGDTKQTVNLQAYDWQWNKSLPGYSIISHQEICQVQIRNRPDRHVFCYSPKTLLLASRLSNTLWPQELVFKMWQRQYINSTGNLHKDCMKFKWPLLIWVRFGHGPADSPRPSCCTTNTWMGCDVHLLISCWCNAVIKTITSVQLLLNKSEYKYTDQW